MKKRADGRYQSNITITDALGNKKRKTFYGKSPAEVRRAILAFTGEQAQGPTLKEVCEEWQAEEGEDVRYNTQVCYKKPTEDVLEAFGPRRIREITTLQIEAFLRQLAKKGFARQTVRVRLVVLNRIYKYALRHGYVEANPAASAELPPGLTAKKREMPSDDILERISKLPPKGFTLLPILLYYTGCRRGEAMALEWSDIDLKNRVIHITKEVEYHGNTPVVVNHTKSEAGYRDIIIRLKLLELLPKRKKTGYLFPGKNGGLMTKGELIEWWDGLHLGVTPHQLRHAYVTELYEAGVDAELAMTQTGHADIKTMRGIYTHIRDSQKDKAKTLLDAYDAPPAEKPEEKK